MTIRRFRSPIKTLFAMLAFGLFLALGPGAASPVPAADSAPATVSTPAPAADAPAGSSTWETWPKQPEGGAPAAAAGEEAGAKTSSGISAGTWGWIAAGVAAAVLIGVAASGGGGGSSSTPSH